MDIKINRTITTRLYTMGELFINGSKTTLTVEDTLTMLEPGIYRVRLSKGSSRRREIAILPDNKSSIQAQKPHRFEPNGSHISSRKNLSVCMGEWLIPGSLKKGAEVYNRLFDRLEKAEARKEPIMLIIIDSNAEHRDPIPYWDEPSHHGCPPSKRRVELNEDDSVDIYEGDTHIRHLTVEEQKALRDA